MARGHVLLVDQDGVCRASLGRHGNNDLVSGCGLHHDRVGLLGQDWHHHGVG